MPPISARYPLVEAAVALCSALLGLACDWSRSRRPCPTKALRMRSDLGLFAFHMLLVCTLVAAALIEFDGGLPPLRMLVPVLVVGFIAAQASGRICEQRGDARCESWRRV